MKRVAVAVGLAGLLLAAVSFYLNVQSAAVAPNVASMSDADRARLEHLSAQVDDLQSRLREMQAGSVAQASSARHAAPGDTQAPESASANADVAAIRAADAERHHAYMADVAQAFRNEAVDTAWATRAASRVSAAFESDEALRGVARTVECRRQTCRVELADDGSNSVSRRLPYILIGLADVLPHASADQVDQGNGRSSMVLYMSNAPNAPSATTTKGPS